MSEYVDVRDLGGAPPEEAPSLGELFGDLSRDFSTLIRQEVELAKAEIREEAIKAGRAGGMLGGAALAGLFCLLFISFAAAWGLAAVMPAGWAFFIVALLYGIGGTLLYTTGRTQLRRVHPVPDETVETLKEDVQWARTQLQ